MVGRAICFPRRVGEARPRHRLTLVTIAVRPISATTHLEFIQTLPSVSFLQTPAWAGVKAEWDSESVGWFDGQDLVGVFHWEGGHQAAALAGQVVGDEPLPAPARAAIVVGAGALAEAFGGDGQQELLRGLQLDDPLG